MAVAHVYRQVLANPEHDPAATRPAARAPRRRAPSGAGRAATPCRRRRAPPRSAWPSAPAPQRPRRALPGSRSAPARRTQARPAGGSAPAQAAGRAAPGPRADRIPGPAGQKERERALRIDRIALTVVDVVRIYGDAHAGHSPPATLRPAFGRPGWLLAAPSPCRSLVTVFAVFRVVVVIVKWWSPRWSSARPS